MKPEEINIFDLKRMLIGDVQPEFLVEVILRIFLLYVLIIFSMRLMGRRMASTLSRNELAALVSLAAAIGIGMQDPTKGILPAFIIAAIIVGFQQSFAKMTFKNKKFESVTQGSFSILVEDGCLKLGPMSKVGLSRDRVFSQLRSKGLTNLGSVQRMYIEAGGSFSILSYDKPKPGLTIIPEWDKEFIQEKTNGDEILCCHRCGSILEESSSVADNCPKCNHKDWVKAIV